MNNKGFAITTILYGTLILFLMLLVSMMGILSSYKNRLELLIDSNNGARDIINGTAGKKKILAVYNTNGGSTYGAYKADSNGDIIYSASVRDRIFTYPNSQNKDELMNYNNTEYIAISRSGCKVTTGSEWNTKADGSGKSFGQTEKVTYNELVKYTVETADYYVLKLYVNWVCS